MPPSFSSRAFPTLGTLARLLAFVTCIVSCAGAPPSPPSCPAAPPPSSTPSRPLAAPGPGGTWLFSCCDDASTWIGMLVLVQEGSDLRGGFLTDGDSHGSYLEGRVDGTRVHLAR